MNNRGRIWSRVDNGILDDEIFLMDQAGLDHLMGFEDIGVQSDGTPVVFDKCGNFGYLDPNLYRFVWDLTE